MIHFKGSVLRWTFFLFGFCVGISTLVFLPPCDHRSSVTFGEESTLKSRLQSFPVNHTKDVHEKIDGRDLRLRSEGKENSPQDVRVLCWIMTHAKNLATKAQAVKTTWGKRCDVLLFVSDEENKQLPTIPVNISTGREHLSNKTLTAFQYVFDNFYNEADWFLKADDDTYVVMENLKYFLSGQNTESAVYHGHRYRPWVNQGYFSGGAGYVISREGLRRFGTRNRAIKACQPRYGGAEDVVFGGCMEYLNVKTGETRDKYGRSRFHSMDIGVHISGDFAKWYYFYDALNGQGGARSISEYPISFHYVTAKNMHALEFLLYRMKLYKKNSTQNVNIPVNYNASWLH